MRVADALEQLLTCAGEALTVPVCRTFQNPGDNAPHDNCEVDEENGTNGQLWVAHTASQPGWPTPSGDPVTCATMWTETIKLGVVRCAMGKVTDDGDVPLAEDVTADAVLQQADRLALRNAIMCCLGIEGQDMIIQGWEAIEPLGGCVGGTWTIFVKDSGCDCANWTS